MNVTEPDETFEAQTAVLLMLRTKNGERESFDELVRTYRTGLVRFLTRLLRNHETAEDLAQETFLRVYRARNLYEPTAKFETWLYKIATNAALNYIRDERQHLASSEEDLVAADRNSRWADQRPGIQSVLMRDEAAQQIRAAVHALPAKQRAAVLLHKYQEMDYRQIAGVLGCSLQAVKSLLWRAYERLREDLAAFDHPVRVSASASDSVPIAPHGSVMSSDAFRERVSA